MLLSKSLEAKKKKENNCLYLKERPKGSGRRPFLSHIHHSDLYKVDNPDMGH